ncbi:MAG: hypothetical protein WCK02_00710 [Bacteroidota bacterium]
MAKKILLILFLFFQIGFGFSQIQLYPNNTDIQFNTHQLLLKRNCSINTSFLPLIRSDFDTVSKYLYNYSGRDSVFISRRSHKQLWKSLRRESWVTIDSAEFRLKFDPYIDFEVSKGIKADTSVFSVNTRGIIVHGEVGKKFNFVTMYSENQATFPEYLRNHISEDTVIPGQGYPKAFKKSGYDYGYASGFIEYNASKYLDFRIGHGKNFIGNGYRSLLLSDAAFNYPYLMTSSKIWKLQYINIFSSYMDINEAHSYESGFRKKYSTSHYLIYKINKLVSIGFFESTIWKTDKSTANKFDLKFINPLIFSNTIQYNLGSENNSMIGLNLDWKFKENNMFYGQLVIDSYHEEYRKEFGFMQQKYGFQLGVRGVNLFKIKNLDYLLEYNQVQPYTYAHKNTLQNYSHYNEPLAHPLGANFQETVIIAKYTNTDFFVNLKINYAFYGADTSGTHWGKDISNSDFAAQRPDAQISTGNHLAQGVRTTLWFKTLTIGFIINPITNMVIEAGVQQRDEYSIISSNKNMYIFVAFRTKLFNHYYDF